MPILPRAAAAVVLVVAVTACTPEPTPVSGEARSLVIAAAVAPTTLDPAAGYAPMGAAKIFDGLLEHQPEGVLRPVLAAAAPVPAADGRSWTVRLRTDVVFHDGSRLDADDVVATYRRARLWMVVAVRPIDPTTVRFELTRPFPAFPSLLVLGITRSQDTAEPTIGTGPYRLDRWEPGRRLVLKANTAYFLGPPAITQVTVEFVPDDEVRAQWLRDGRLDGADLPARLAAAFAGRSDFTVVEHAAADLRVVMLPQADPAVVLALNLATDRQALVDTALAGKGRPASGPMPAALAEFVEPGLRFTQDVPRAKAILDSAGLPPGSDGVRTALSVAYPVADVAARDLLAGLVKQAAAIGIRVIPQPTPRATPLTGPRLLAVGDAADPGAALSWLVDPSQVKTADTAGRAVAYRAIQRAYVARPSAVVLAEARHSYVLRRNWTGYQPVVDGVGTDHTWGAWWNLQTWTPR